ncbi:MAG: hypothetical protein P8O77_07805, partial [Emcibacteraceae bacterium]|nr:hypothetical protein [Emcibacteraceae bacterium]
MQLSKQLKNTSAIVTLSLISGLTLPSSAQQVDDENVDTIYVTGSFIKRKSQENSSSPLNVISTGDLSAQGLNTLGDLARNMTF